jgi:protein-tyrosine phosphatase
MRRSGSSSVVTVPQQKTPARSGSNSKQGGSLAPGSIVEMSGDSSDESYDSDPEEVVIIRRSSVGQNQAHRIGMTSSSEAASHAPSASIPIRNKLIGVTVTDEMSGSWDGHATSGTTPPVGSYMHYARSPMSNSMTDMEGSYGPNNGLESSTDFSGTPPLNASANLAKGAGSRSASLAASPGQHGATIKYFLNDDVVKHRMRVNTADLTVSRFSGLVRQAHKLPSDDFAIFSYDTNDAKLRIVKESSPMREDEVYNVIENSKLDKIFKKIEDKVKKTATMSMADNKGRSVWTSDNNPMKVDFIPETEILMNQMGRIGLCMAPGRKKKKAHHDWDRDLDKDLDRIQKSFNCDVFVSLIRTSEMIALKIPNLFEEVEKRGMESIHFPIKDKWIPNSMDGLIALVDALIQRLKEGKTIIIHCNGGKGRSATVAVAILIGLGKKVQNSIEVVRKTRSGTIRNPLQIMYVKRFKKAWKAFQKKRLNKGKDSDSDTDLTDDSEDDDISADEEAFKHDDADDTSGAEGDQKSQKRKKQDEERRLKDAKKQAEREKEEARKKEKEAKKEEERRKEEAKKEEEKRKKEEKHAKKEEEKQRKLDEQGTPGKPEEKDKKDEKPSKPDDKSGTPKAAKEKRTTDSIDGNDTGSGAEQSREKKTFVKKGKDETKPAKSPLKVDVEAAASTPGSPSPTEPEAPTTPSRSRRKLLEEAAAAAAAPADPSEPSATLVESPPAAAPKEASAQ